MECVVSGMHINMKDRKYITIGTVPLVGVGQSAPSAPPNELPSPSQPAVLPVAPGQSAQPGNVCILFCIFLTYCIICNIIKQNFILCNTYRSIYLSKINKCHELDIS